jgi:2-keto-3-deoxy-L-rhamnonate aldolase RhmA
MKYHPLGKRGVALQVAHDRYRPGTVADKFTAANRRTTLFCQVETAEGVENADALAGIDGVDCLWVGHFDLSVSLGVPGEFDHPTFSAAIERVVAATRKHNKALGRLVPTVEQGLEFYAQGFDFICYSGDVWVLHNAAISGSPTGPPPIPTSTSSRCAPPPESRWRSWNQRTRCAASSSRTSTR